MCGKESNKARKRASETISLYYERRLAMPRQKAILTAQSPLPWDHTSIPEFLGSRTGEKSPESAAPSRNDFSGMSPASARHRERPRDVTDIMSRRETRRLPGWQDPPRLRSAFRAITRADSSRLPPRGPPPTAAVSKPYRRQRPTAPALHPSPSVTRPSTPARGLRLAAAVELQSPAG